MPSQSPRSPKKKLTFGLSNAIRSPGSPSSNSKKKFSLARFGKSLSWPSPAGGSLPSLATLLREKDFDNISDILRDGRAKHDASVWFDAEYSMSGENCLHRLLKSRPPAPLVSLMLERLTEYGIEDPELSIDHIGQTPLHYAVANCCNPQVIAVLVGTPKGKTSVLAQDDMGRLPLHVAMRPYNLFNESEDAMLMRQDPFALKTTLRMTIAILIDACPQSLFLKNDRKKSPLDLARALDFDGGFGRWVQHTAEILAKTELFWGCCEPQRSEFHPGTGMVIKIPKQPIDSFDDDEVLSALTLVM